MKKSAISLVILGMLLLVSWSSFAIDAPSLSVTSGGTNVALSWTPVSDATGYLLYYAPYPDSQPVRNVNLGNQTEISFTLWDGAAFYVAVKSYNAQATSGFSNVDFFNLANAEGLGLESTAFGSGNRIPDQHTCLGVGISPPLQWSGAPVETKSFALLMDDPDAPGGTFRHWVIYDIPATSNGLAEEIPTLAEIEQMKQGINDFGAIGYGPPCPPPGHGVHNYSFRLYALDISSLGLPAGADFGTVEMMIDAHVLASAELIGTYSR
ncbi:MAG: YbhB/YbcL family Raf kinase inhibitor-like protein [Thermodesulfobacteriota bacterium]|nr:YbhB/YbcL family Raf kinase inhibitor-like protein [Thermodesulfobacteriota bacterium]